MNPALAQALDRELHDHRVSKCTGDKPCESQSQHTLLGHLSHSGDPLQLVNEYSQGPIKCILMSEIFSFNIHRCINIVLEMNLSKILSF